jgi:hypothetical protein
MCITVDLVDILNMGFDPRFLNHIVSGTGVVLILVFCIESLCSPVSRDKWLRGTDCLQGYMMS